MNGGRRRLPLGNFYQIYMNKQLAERKNVNRDDKSTTGSRMPAKRQEGVVLVDFEVNFARNLLDLISGGCH